jgi:hypothetical protein
LRPDVDRSEANCNGTKAQNHNNGLRFKMRSQYNSSAPNLTHSTFTGMLIRPHQFRNAGLSRRLGLLLIAFILYGTTVEAAHRHGRVASNKSDATSVVHSENAGRLTGSQTGCGDCLICQLHHNFSTTLIALRLNDPPARVLHKATVVLVPHLLARIISPLAGRAPPFIS